MGFYDPIPMSPIEDDAAQNWPLIARTITDEVVQIPIPPPVTEPRPGFWLRRAQTFRSFFSRRGGNTKAVSHAKRPSVVASTATVNGKPIVVLKPVLKHAPKPKTVPKPAALKPALKPYRSASTATNKRKSMARKSMVGGGVPSDRASKRMTRISMIGQDFAIQFAAPPPPPPPVPKDHTRSNAHKHRSMYESFDNYNFSANMQRASVMVVGSQTVMI